MAAAPGLSAPKVASEVAQASGYVLPLLPTAQRLTIMLGGVSYIMQTQWSTPSACWLLDISDIDDVPIVRGIPMVTGVDLLEQYRYLGFKGSLFAYSTEGPPDVVPTFTSLGRTAQVAYFADAVT